MTLQRSLFRFLFDLNTKPHCQCYSLDIKSLLPTHVFERLLPSCWCYLGRCKTIRRWGLTGENRSLGRDLWVIDLVLPDVFLVPDPQRCNKQDSTIPPQQPCCPHCDRLCPLKSQTKVKCIHPSIGGGAVITAGRGAANKVRNAQKGQHKGVCLSLIFQSLSQPRPPFLHL